MQAQSKKAPPSTAKKKSDNRSLHCFPSYVGRFAPSPTGELHLGSLVCALASYLDARAHQGKWLLRIEDIDPPREQRGAGAAILTGLERHGLYWDEEVVYQSKRLQAYEDTLNKLANIGLSYRCSCIRKRLITLTQVYDGYCLEHTPPPEAEAAIRLNTAKTIEKAGVSDTTCFTDLIQGQQQEAVSQTGDFIIHRKDKLFAYQLAVVVDDIEQKINHIVRGADLLPTTAKQIILFKILNQRVPSYAHIPVIVDKAGAKLSKQSHAPILDNRRAFENIYKAIKLLGLAPEKANEYQNQEQLLEWAIAHWDLSLVPKAPSLLQ